MNGVETFNLHAHLPQLERLGESAVRMQVLARQRIDLSAPPHLFVQEGRENFDALLQSAPDAFAGEICASMTARNLGVIDLGSLSAHRAALALAVSAALIVFAAPAMATENGNMAYPIGLNTFATGVIPASGDHFYDYTVRRYGIRRDA